MKNQGATTGNSPAWKLMPETPAPADDNYDPLKEETSTTLALEHALFSTLRLHSKDFNSTANPPAIDQVEWEQVKGKTLEIKPDVRADSRMLTQHSRDSGSPRAKQNSIERKPKEKVMRVTDDANKSNL